MTTLGNKFIVISNRIAVGNYSKMPKMTNNTTFQQYLRIKKASNCIILNIYVYTLYNLYTYNILFILKST